MNDRILDIARLLILQKERPLTDEERSILDKWVSEHPENAVLMDQIQDEKWIKNELSVMSHYDAVESRKVLESKLRDGRKIYRMDFLRTAWFRYAVAITLLVVTGGTIYYFNSDNDTIKPADTTVNPVPVKNDVAPGGNKATLTLADGQILVLDSVADGQFANQGGARLIKLTSGQIAYKLHDLSSKEVMWNTISTPKGGQYQVTLPDGTHVWLNASSSISFPTAFVAGKREVRITGEIYFEVAKNRQKPFVIDIDGKSSVEVLGTSFNINSYPDEGSIKTTLLEGSVKVSSVTSSAEEQSISSGRVDDHTKSVILKPGQQAIDRPSKSIVVSSKVDLDQAFAWKNGIFDFTGADLKTVMRQLERWYDIKIQYKGSISDMTFEGRMYRNVNLSDVLEVLQKMGVKFELDGKNLTVL